MCPLPDLPYVQETQGGKIMEIVRGGVVSKLLEGVPIPKMFRAKQSFPRPLIKREDPYPGPLVVPAMGSHGGATAEVTAPDP